MKIKRLLLGSAAVLVAVTGARAADPVAVVEPEPVEYVRICDVYGNGFFYLPGTETCLKLSGNVRVTYKHYSKRNKGGIATGDNAVASYRVRLQFDVRNETEYGTLQSYVRLQGSDSTSEAITDAGVVIDKAWISINGWLVGWNDSYWASAHGYGGGGYGGGYYSYKEGLMVQYTYGADGFSITGGAEILSGGGTTAAESPNPYVGVKYSSSVMRAAATYAYDTAAGASGEGAWKVSVDFPNIGESGWDFGGWYLSDSGMATAYGTQVFAADDFAWGLRTNGTIADNLDLYANYSEVTGSAVGERARNLEVGLYWTPVSGLAINPQISHTATSTGANSFYTGMRVVRSW